MTSASLTEAGTWQFIRRLTYLSRLSSTGQQGHRYNYRQSPYPNSPSYTTAAMSFDQLSSLESQPNNTRRQDDPQYADDPEFQHVSQDLMSKLLALGGNVSKLSNQIALLGTKRETERVRERVQTLLEELKDSFKEAGEGVKKIQAWEDVSPSQKYTQQKVVREFQNNLTTFQGVQRQALEKQRSSASAARMALEEEPAHGEEGSGQVGQQQAQEHLRLASQDEVDFQESLIVEREAEIRNIEQGVTELNELFRDVAHIVSEQGEQLDIIDQNVDNTRTDTRGADQELRSAARYQRNARSKGCILLVILAVILTIIILAAIS